MTCLLKEKNGAITELTNEEVFENSEGNIVIRMVDNLGKIRQISECLQIKK